ncbi:MAG: carboxylating nicotinate-nucleotide diphosphorylase [Actinomycetota bacterium]|jgi:nicotinate-nucleotide pyrophosphorylase (carboxylating)|nr:carboxylating nicotinate-nucleotide diphosphorylase [Actinomycetota bacterium]
MKNNIADIYKEDYENIVKSAIAEDLGAYGDITSKYIFNKNNISDGFIICKEKDGATLCGIGIAEYIFKTIDSSASLKILRQDGEKIKNKEKICTFHGKTISVLKSERIALNFISHLSGIATLTRKFTDIASDYGVKVSETRKTLPNLRLLEKYAVRCGGGFNHRFGLFDGVMIKDNHIIASGGVSKAIEKIRSEVPHTLKIEVEVKTDDDLEQAIKSKADIIMLDNMDCKHLRDAVKKIREILGNTCIIEASGGISLKTLEEICKTGIDIVSVGALTNSAKAIDFSLDFE